MGETEGARESGRERGRKREAEGETGRERQRETEERASMSEYVHQGGGEREGGSIERQQELLSEPLHFPLETWPWPRVRQG